MNNMKKIPEFLTLLFLLSCASQKTSLREEFIKEETKKERVVRTEEEKNIKEGEFTKGATPQINARELFNEGIALLEKNLLEESKIKFQDSILIDPALNESYYNLAVISFKEGKMEDAITFIKKYLENKRDSLKALTLLLNIYIHLGKASSAYSFLKQKKEEFPDNILIANLFLRAKIESGEIHEVLKSATDLLKKDETNIEIIKTLAIYYIKVKKFGMAKFVLRNALEFAKDAELYSLLGEVYVKLDENLLAIDSFKKALELNPNMANVHNNLGVLYLKAEDYESSLLEFDEAMRVCPYIPEFYINRGNVLKKLIKFAEAKESYERALQLNEKMPEIYYNLGVLYLEYKKEGDEGVRNYTQAIDYLNKYKEKRGGTPERESEVDKYIAEAKRMLDYLKEKKQKEEEEMKKPQPKKEKEGETQPEKTSTEETPSPPSIEETPEDEEKKD